jgi:ribosomal protein S18 acetylase RimI-like enzyme
VEIETRWMKRSDSAAAITIANACGDKMDEKRMDRLVSKTGVVCMVAEVDGRVVGLMAYDLSKVSKINILKIAVEDQSRRMGVGSALVDLVTSKLNKKRSKIELVVSEYNVGAQLFLRSMGFQAVSVVKIDEGSSDYRFMYRLNEPTPADS